MKVEQIAKFFSAMSTKRDVVIFNYVHYNSPVTVNDVRREFNVQYGVAYHALRVLSGEGWLIKSTREVEGRRPEKVYSVNHDVVATVKSAMVSLGLAYVQ